MTPVDLRSIAGKRYRLTTETGEPVRQSTDPWHLVIPCRYGAFYPHSPDRLAVQTKGHKRLEVAALACVKVTQRGDTELIAVFSPADFKAVAALVLPKRRRVLSPEHLAKLAASNAAHKFTVLNAADGSAKASAEDDGP